MDFINVGDILQLEKGFDAMCAEIPEVYFKGRHPYSEKLTNGVITVGEPKPPRCPAEELRDELTKLVKFAFAYHKTPLDFSILERFIKHQVPDRNLYPFIVPEGKYVVTEVSGGEGPRKEVRCETYKPFPNQIIRRIYFTKMEIDFVNCQWCRIVGNVCDGQ